MIIHADEYYTYEKTLHLLQIMKMYYDTKGDKSIFEKMDIHTSDYNGSWGAVYAFDVCLDIINELFDTAEIFTPHSIDERDKEYPAYLEKCLSLCRKHDFTHLRSFPSNSDYTESEYIKFTKELMYSSHLIFIEGNTSQNPYFINLHKSSYDEFILAEGFNQDSFCIIVVEDFYYSNMDKLVDFLLESKRIIDSEDIKK
ncbi:hypothetical protein PVA17_22685 [Lysinibacillus sp. CNPSo 3705]|uniref:hypothetical protein n=1 Tax=Lysinibacillus sp. CNPSo 3705 TaxID=3028148 RepID=UPI002363E10A|nr:hypothetical protein [Lysinibacillus sp. CNPSo 3705]MDD1505530.1 hypothetical protein [Lysinibacillus sp. CNPSo 3705]